MFLTFAGGDVANAWELVELPPEICELHVGMKGSLCRGAMRLPSVLHSLEMTLVAAELRDLIGPPISCFEVPCTVLHPPLPILLCNNTTTLLDQEGVLLLLLHFGHIQFSMVKNVTVISLPSKKFVQFKGGQVTDD